jgi:hypothetical protein
MRLMERSTKRPGKRSNTGSELRADRVGAARQRIVRTRTWLWAAGCVFAGVFLVTAVDRGQQAPAASPDKPVVQPEANQQGNATPQMQARDPQKQKLSPEAANGDRKKQFSDDSARLLKLANELKAEVDKTDKDTLSIAVIRKADEIERLAHMVKEKMRLTAGSN